MTTYILEYDKIGKNEGPDSFVNQQFDYKQSCASQPELNEVIGKLPAGTRGRYDDGTNWYYFTAGQSGTVVTSAGLTRHPLE
jgi:hypothetical protein